MMGQAKQRGTLEQRKAEAEKREAEKRLMNSQLLQRRPSPKHVALMGMIAAMTQDTNLHRD